MSDRPELLVEQGIQAGLSASIAPGASVVGSDLDAAVVIADPALLPSHFELVFEGGRTALRALSGAVTLHDGTALAPGQDIVCAEACHFTAGNTRFALRLPEAAATAPAIEAAAVGEAAPEASARRDRRVVPVMAGMVALSAFGLLMFTAVGLRAGRATPATAGHAAHAVVASIAGPRAASLDQVTRDLRGRLDGAGLAALAVAPARDGSLMVQGALFPAQMAAWGGVREWYDMEYGNGRVLVDQVLPAGAGPAMTIAAVWAGNSPYVVDERGEKLFVGAAVGGGWTIKAIQAGHVVVQNGEQKVAVRY